MIPFEKEYFKNFSKSNLRGIQFQIFSLSQIFPNFALIEFLRGKILLRYHQWHRRQSNKQRSTIGEREGVQFVAAICSNSAPVHSVIKFGSDHSLIRLLVNLPSGPHYFLRRRKCNEME